MGKGKGNPEYWAAVVEPGRIIFEIDGVTPEVAKEAMGLAASDLMISDVEKPLCIAGVFGGLNSGVKDATTTIFLESAWFDNVTVRKTSVHHGLRTDAATRFEKGVDIENTVKVLERAALMIQEIAGGKIGQVVDLYPHPATKTKVVLPLAYLKKLSGKLYPTDKVVTILKSLGFEILQQTSESIEVAVPYHKPDISLPADLVVVVRIVTGKQIGRAHV